MSNPGDAHFSSAEDETGDVFIREGYLHGALRSNVMTSNQRKAHRRLGLGLGRICSFLYAIGWKPHAIGQISDCGRAS